MPTVPEPSRRNWAWWVGRVVIGFALLGLVAIARVCVCTALNFGTGGSHAPFDESGWKRNWTLSCTPIRQQMVGDLIQSRPLVGSSRDKVVALLGDSDRKPYLLVEQPRWADSMIYLLGPDHLSLDSEWLVITFDETERVAEVLVVND
jgi:hypothetical protein